VKETFAFISPSGRRLKISVIGAEEALLLGAAHLPSRQVSSQLRLFYITFQKRLCVAAER